jgi:hypothetical protein
MLGHRHAQVRISMREWMRCLKQIRSVDTCTQGDLICAPRLVIVEESLAAQTFGSARLLLTFFITQRHADAGSSHKHWTCDVWMRPVKPPCISPGSGSLGCGVVLLGHGGGDAPAVADRDALVFRPGPDVCAALPA